MSLVHFLNYFGELVISPRPTEERSGFYLEYFQLLGIKNHLIQMPSKQGEYQL